MARLKSDPSKLPLRVGTILRVEPGAPNEAARLHHPCQLSGYVAACGARLAVGDAGDRISAQRIGWS